MAQFSLSLPRVTTAAFGLLRRVVAGRLRLFASAGVGLLSFLALPGSLNGQTRAIMAWDIGSLLLLLLYAHLFSSERRDGMAEDAERQQEGEWTIFWITLAAAAFSFGAVVLEFSGTKSLPAETRGLHVALVAATLLLSWLVTHILFALRYAHEYYERGPGPDGVLGGLDFPGDEPPDYWDFTYFALVLGMTFQVSDVEITSRKLRRLATVHGVVSFVFNTVIVALTVNIAASLL